ALSVYLNELVRQYFQRVATYVAEDWDDTWRGAGMLSDWSGMRLTPDQLRALNAELSEVIARHAPAPDAEPGPDALPVVVQLQSFPRAPRDAG
ncbi:ArsR family transcriptional regulator, partial [Streptomyces sp. SID11233]|nr:ArsR family transcriptional regulator [Streptomyces sp. SID11233]